jgi:F0F1-type ATP synthase membrane subunit c/vacuolar-type H+-ATPase subunit K
LCFVIINYIKFSIGILGWNQTGLAGNVIGLGIGKGSSAMDAIARQPEASGKNPMLCLLLLIEGVALFAGGLITIIKN